MAAWLLERKHPDGYAQTVRERSKGAEEMTKIVFGVARAENGGDATEDAEGDETDG